MRFKINGIIYKFHNKIVIAALFEREVQKRERENYIK